MIRGKMIVYKTRDASKGLAGDSFNEEYTRRIYAGVWWGSDRLKIKFIPDEHNR